MPYSIELFTRNPIVLFTAGPDWSPVELDHVLDDLVQVLDTTDQPLNLVTDLRGLSLEYVELLQGIARMTRDKDALLRHPNLRDLVVVADDPVVLKAANTLNEPQFDAISVTVTPMLAQALLRLGVRGLSSALSHTVPA